MTLGAHNLLGESRANGYHQRQLCAMTAKRGTPHGMPRRCATLTVAPPSPAGLHPGWPPPGAWSSAACTSLGQATAVATCRRSSSSSQLPCNTTAALGVYEAQAESGGGSHRAGHASRADSASGLLHTATAVVLGGQRSRLLTERDNIAQRRAQWEAAQRRLEDLQHWRQQMAATLGQFTYDQKRTAHFALGISVRVWRQGHSPRYQIEMSIPVSDAQSPLVAGTYSGRGRWSSGAGGRCRCACRTGPAAR